MTKHITITAQQMLQDNALFKKRIRSYDDFIAYLRKHKSSTVQMVEKVMADDDLFFYVFTEDRQIKEAILVVHWSLYPKKYDDEPFYFAIVNSPKRFDHICWSSYNFHFNCNKKSELLLLDKIIATALQDKTLFKKYIQDYVRFSKLLENLSYRQPLLNKVLEEDKLFIHIFKKGSQFQEICEKYKDYQTPLLQSVISNLKRLHKVQWDVSEVSACLHLNPLYQQLFRQIVDAVMHKKKYFKRYLTNHGFTIIFKQKEFRSRLMTLILKNDELLLYVLPSSLDFSYFIRDCRKFQESAYEDQLLNKLLTNSKIFTTLIKTSFDFFDVSKLNTPYSNKILDKIFESEHLLHKIINRYPDIKKICSFYPERITPIVSLLTTCSDERFLSFIRFDFTLNELCCALPQLKVPLLNRVINSERLFLKIFRDIPSEQIVCSENCSMDNLLTNNYQVIQFCESLPEFSYVLWDAHHRYLLPRLVDFIITIKPILTGRAISQIIDRHFSQLQEHKQWDFVKARFSIPLLNKAYQALADHPNVTVGRELAAIQQKYLQQLPNFTLKELCLSSLNRHLFLKQQAINSGLAQDIKEMLLQNIHVTAPITSP